MKLRLILAIFLTLRFPAACLSAQSAPHFTPGSLDLSFNAGELDGGLPQGGPVIGPPGTHVEDIALAPDGRIYIGGHLSSVQGVRRDAIARLHSSGTLDIAFAEPVFDDNGFALSPGLGDVHNLFLQPDGHVVAGWSCFNRLKPNGLLDDSLTNCIGVAAVFPNGNLVGWKQGESQPWRIFLPDGRQASNSPALELPITVQLDGRILTGEARWNADWTIDQSFQWTGVERTNQIDLPLIPEILLLPDGKYLRTGRFTERNAAGKIRTHFLARFDSSGSFDPSFDASAVFPPFSGVFISAVAAQPNGKVLVGYTGYIHLQGGLVRLNEDGTLDKTFQVGRGLSAEAVIDSGTVTLPGAVKRILIQPDGRILISGNFTHVNGISRLQIARLHGDGDPAPGFTLSVSPITVGDTLQVAVSGPAGSNLRLQRSTNLRDWEDWRSFSLTESLTNFVDASTGTVVHQFYRAISP